LRPTQDGGTNLVVRQHVNDQYLALPWLLLDEGRARRDPHPHIKAPVAI
jgi:hypothetical protein